MRTLESLFAKNRQWAQEMERRDKGFFSKLSERTPEYLWIGCSDSRVPANEIVGLMPGEMFVHRNIANQIDQSDLNCMSVVEFAIEKLRVRHIIVCGHYGCKGVEAAMNNEAFGLVDRWLGRLRGMIDEHRQMLAPVAELRQRLDRCCEINVLRQVRNLCSSGAVDLAWRRGWELSVHGWIYDIADGLLRDLGLCVTAPGEIDSPNMVMPDPASHKTLNRAKSGA